MTVTGTKQTVDIESEMSGYSVSFGNVFNPFVTGAVASALPTYSNFRSNGRQHITQYTPSFLCFKDAHYNVGEMHLKNGIITGENADGRIGVVIEEHLKNRVEMEQHSRSFSMNPGAMAAFCMAPNLVTATMAVPVDRKVSSTSVHENYAQSGIHIKDNHVEIGEKIEIKPTLRNEEHLHVFDTATINSIGNISAGIQEIQDLAKEVRQFKEAEIKDASPDIQEHVGEDFEEKFVEEAKVLVAKADEVKKAIEEKKPEAQETHTVQLKTYDDIVDECIDAYFASQSTDPRDSVISAQTNGDVEDLVRKATLLRYDLEDFIAKYPNAAEWCAKIFVGATYVLQGAEYVLAFGAAGPAGVGAKYATQEGIATGVEHGIEAASNASAATLTKDPILQTEYSQTLKCFSYIGMCLGSVKPAKQLVKALKHGSAVRKQAQQSVASEFKFPSTKGYYKSVTKGIELSVLNRKQKILVDAQNSAITIKKLPDGRVRYYGVEKPADKPGKIRGAGFVTEYNPNNGNVRLWYEVRDHSGNVIFVHPKNINGVDLDVPHYPNIPADFKKYGGK